MPNQVNIAIIGSGFSSLSNACYLAKMGYTVEVFEKNNSLGGRARSKEINGFVFDMGPSWYWMPDVFERFYADFNTCVEKHYDLIRLDPSYRVFWKDKPDDIPAQIEELYTYFEQYEKGSGKKLQEFLHQAKIKYEVGMNDFVTKPSLSYIEFISLGIAKKAMSLDLFKSISKHIRRYFTHPRLIELLEFPVLFLGAKPRNTPALYSLMNYADMVMGTWYPMGGMNNIVQAMVSIAKGLNVKFNTNAAVEEILIENNSCVGVVVNGKKHSADVIVSGADYHHTEQKLLPKPYRIYSNSYWESRTMAPSSLLYYVGLNTRLKGIKHHNLFFDEDFNEHAVEIYDTHQWPKKPLFYICSPSITDSSVAPKGKENLFFLVPVSTELSDTESIKEQYFTMICNRLEKHIGVDIRPHIEVFESFAHSDFITEYHSFKGNAYGLANTLRQTAILKPRCKNKKLKNLYYIGQLTVPGPGVPPSIISGKIVANLINQEHKLS